jgi:hypothetical protein
MCSLTMYIPQTRILNQALSVKGQFVNGAYIFLKCQPIVFPIDSPQICAKNMILPSASMTSSNFVIKAEGPKVFNNS